METILGFSGLYITGERVPVIIDDFKPIQGNSSDASAQPYLVPVVDDFKPMTNDSSDASVQL